MEAFRDPKIVDPESETKLYRIDIIKLEYTWKEYNGWWLHIIRGG